MANNVKYHLVDKIYRQGSSQRHIKTFDSFKELKDFVTNNVVELYKAIPEPEKNAPDYTSEKGFMDLKRKMEKNKYMGWYLSIIKTDNTGSSIKKLKGNRRWNYVKIEEGSFNRYNRYKNGVHENYLGNLGNINKKILKNSELFRVVNETSKAVRVEWTSPKGSFTEWIPKIYLG